MSKAPHDDLAERWRDAWPDALALWSRFTRLRPPVLCTTRRQARAEGLTGSFAMIRLTDQSVVIDLPAVVRLGLAERPLEVLGHEIGHHIAAPASLLVNGRAIARMRVALPGVEQHAPMLANLYADLLINDRLQRDHGLRIDALYRAIDAAGSSGSSPLWTMYQRSYEILWSLQRGTLADGAPAERLEGDAQLCARLIRSYQRDWLDGAGRFAALCFPYFEQDPADALGNAGPWGDSLSAGAGADAPAGLSDIDPDELDGAIHPAMDPDLSGLPGDVDASGAQDDPPAARRGRSGGGTGQRRELLEYGAILRQLGLDLTDHDLAVRYYREQAMPHLIPFPAIPQPVPGETLPEGFAPWTPGEPLEDIDWLQSVLTSPVVIPGVTTVQRVHGTDDVHPPKAVPLDLDLYIDCSGSMPNPQHALSYPALAGTVLVLSALRAGARVQATLWSGAGQFQTTEGFTTDRDAILRVVLGYIGGGTAFPLNVLRETYADRTSADPAVHLLVVSDWGVDTILADDEQGTAGSDVVRQALAAAGGGGTMLLELPGITSAERLAGTRLGEVQQLGWTIEPVSTLEELLGAARRFARTTYQHAAPGEVRTRG